MSTLGMKLWTICSSPSRKHHRYFFVSWTMFYLRVILKRLALEVTHLIWWRFAEACLSFTFEFFYHAEWRLDFVSNYLERKAIRKESLYGCMDRKNDYREQTNSIWLSDCELQQSCNVSEENRDIWRSEKVASQSVHSRPREWLTSGDKMPSGDSEGGCSIDLGLAHMYMKNQELIHHDNEDRDRCPPRAPGKLRWMDGDLRREVTDLFRLYSSLPFLFLPF